MTGRIAEVILKIRELEAELDRELTTRQERWQYRFEAGRIRFEKAVRDYHRKLKRGVIRFLRESSVPNLLTAPIIYSIILPLALADVWISLYQRVCFPIYGIPRVNRSDFIALDRRHLGYLNSIEKVNCDYCSYANGLIAYLREVTARTEQYWCPIRHARRVKAPHARYRLFVDYGDAEGYHQELPVLRRALRDQDRP